MQLTRLSSSKAIEAKGGALEKAEKQVPSLLEFQSPTAAIIALPVPGVARWTTWVIGSMWACFLAAITFWPIQVVVTGLGKIASMDQPIVLSPVETSVVRGIYVHNNEVVKAGDLLARLDPTFPTSDRDMYQAQVAGYGAEVAREQAELNKKPFAYTGTDPSLALQAALYAQRKAQFDFTVENYNQQIKGLEAQVERAKSDEQGYQQRLSTAASEEGLRRELERLQVGSRLNTLIAQDQRQEMQRFLDFSVQTEHSTQGQLDATRAQRDAYMQQWFADTATALATAATNLSNAQEALNKAALRTQMVELRADQDATVLNVAKVSNGTVLNPGDEFISLIPMNSKLEAQVFVSSSDQGWLTVGDQATIKLDTFPFTRYGTGTGTLRYISPDSFNGTSNSMLASGQALQSSPNPITSTLTQISPPIPQVSSQPSFLVRVSIDQLNLKHVPSEFRLLPGMSTTVDVDVGSRTILEYLLDRILPLGIEAMREP
jgi:HlyD family secretion protein